MGCCKSAGKIKVRAAAKRQDKNQPSQNPPLKFGQVQHYAPGGVPKNG